MEMFRRFFETFRQNTLKTPVSFDASSLSDLILDLKKKLDFPPKMVVLFKKTVFVTESRAVLRLADGELWLSSSQTYQAVLLPGFWEFGSLLLPGDQDLHVLKSWVVPHFRLKSHLVLWHRLSCRKAEGRADDGF